MEVTADHPIYIEGQGWLNAENLAVGDRLRRADGGMATVLAIERVKLVEPEAVYNFTVKGPHTYFVLDAQVLVHNCSSGDGDYFWSSKSNRWYLPGRRGTAPHIVSHSEVPYSVVKRVAEELNSSDRPNAFQQSIDVQTLWFLNNLKAGKVDKVVRSLGFDPNSAQVAKLGLKQDLLDMVRPAKAKLAKGGEMWPIDAGGNGARSKALHQTIQDYLSPEIPIIAVRSIPVGSDKYWGHIKHKPMGATVLEFGKNPKKRQALKGSNGIRIIYDKKGRFGEKGEVYLVVSDLDAGVVIKQDGGVMSNKDFEKAFIPEEKGATTINHVFSEYLGRKAIMVDHGHQVFGFAWVKGVPTYPSVEKVYVYNYHSNTVYIEDLPFVLRDFADPNDPTAREFFQNLYNKNEYSRFDELNLGDEWGLKR